MESTDPAAAFKDFEHAGWETVAADYAAHFGGLTAQSVAPLLDRAGVGNGTRVLDVATGPGLAAAAAADRGAQATGLDFSAEQVALARQTHPAPTFREGDAEALPFADGSFDAVVMNFGLLHLPHPARALAEANRVLGPGGRAAFTVWETPGVAVGFGITLDAIEAHGDKNVTLPEGPPFFQFSDPDFFRRALLDAGFAGPRVESVPLVWKLASPDEFFRAIYEGSVRTRSLLGAQAPDALEAIRREIGEKVKAYEKGGVTEIPMPAVLASAGKT